MSEKLLVMVVVGSPPMPAEDHCVPFDLARMWHEGVCAGEGGVGMRRPRLSRVGAVVMAVWLAFAVVSSSRAVAQAARPVGDAQAMTLDGTFSPAGVGRLPELAGPGFVAPVIQAAFYGRVSTGSGVYVPASSGDELLFLSVTLYTFAPPVGSSDLTYKAGLAPALSVDFAGSTVALPQSPRGAIDGVAGSGSASRGSCIRGSGWWRSRRACL